MSKVALVSLSAFFAIFLAFYFYLGSLERGYGTYAVLPDGTKITVAIAKTDEERARGLGGRDYIDENEGMYFLFPKEDRYGFWMKDMQFSIDILWVKQGKLVGFVKNVQPEPGKGDGELALYHPPEPVSSVLEMKAGSVVRYGLKAGDKIKVQIIPDKR